MFFYEGYICPVCKQKFQLSDDIVACPECGAPHHRDCWNQEKHCNFADDHGTPRQWKRVVEPSSPTPAGMPTTPPPPSSPNKFCPRCGQQNLQYAEFCSRCGQSLSTSEWGSTPNNVQHTHTHQGQPPYGNSPYPSGYGEYAPYHMPTTDCYGGVPRDATIEDVAVQDIVTFVGPSSTYYLPRFYKMKNTESHTSWNWPAFFVTAYWLLYRKNYLAGSLVLLFSVIQTFLSSYIFDIYIRQSLDMTTDATMTNSLYSLIQRGEFTAQFAILSLLFFSNLLIKIIFGLIGNTIYMRTSLSRIKKIRNRAIEGSTLTQIEIPRELAANGGVSLVLVVIASGIVWFGQVLFQALFLYT